MSANSQKTICCVYNTVGRGNSKGKGPEAGKCLAYPREGPNASVLTAEQVRQTVEQAEGGETPETHVSSVPPLTLASSVSLSAKRSY